MKNLVTRLAATVAIFAANACQAQPTQCPENYLRGQAPDITNERLTIGLQELCNPGFGAFHSGVARTPLWSAEHLTPGRLHQAYKLPRGDDFRADDRLPADARAELADFTRTGFDRGHMAPAADMPTPAADSASFLLSNIVPQAAKLNRGPWADLESLVRKMANRAPLYVITGSLFEGRSIKRLKGRVLVPSALYKVVYVPQRNQVMAWVADNNARGEPERVDVAALEARAGIRFFPGSVQ